MVGCFQEHHQGLDMFCSTFTCESTISLDFHPSADQPFFYTELRTTTKGPIRQKSVFIMFCMRCCKIKAVKIGILYRFYTDTEEPIIIELNVCITPPRHCFWIKTLMKSSFLTVHQVYLRSRAAS